MKENIFPAVFEIIDQTRTMTAALERMEREERQIAADYCELYEQEKKSGKGNRDFSKLKTAREDKERKLSENQTAKTQIKILLPILHDNAQAKAADILRPYIADILQKYAGKKPGPKTADRIREEFHAVTGCYIYFNDSATRSYISIVMDNSFFSYGDMEFTTKAGFTTADNKIIAVAADEISLNNAPAPCNNPEERAAEIIAAYKAMKEAEAETQRKIKAFNALLPAGIESIHQKETRGYIVATW